VHLAKEMEIKSFYFPHMKYGKVLVSPPENQKKNFAFYHILGLIIHKKTCFGEGQVQVPIPALPGHGSKIPYSWVIDSP
jgi:hypothetical protein